MKDPVNFANLKYIEMSILLADRDLYERKRVETFYFFSMNKRWVSKFTIMTKKEYGESVRRKNEEKE